MMHSYGYAQGYGYVFGPFDFLFHLLGLIIVIVLIIMAVRLICGRPRRWRHMHMMGSPALDVLAERYAKGEISKEEYEERKNVLSQ